MCDRFALKRLKVSMWFPSQKVSNIFPVSTPGACMAFFDGVSMQEPWGIDVGFMEVSCKFLNVVVAWRLLIPTDEVFMEVPRRFHGE